MKLSEFRKKFGEGTDFDLDYGKLVIIGLCIYIAVQVSWKKENKILKKNGLLSLLTRTI